MIDHMSSYAIDYPATRKSYGAAMKSLGVDLQVEQVIAWDPEFPERRTAGWGPDRPVFWVIETKQTISPRHFAFTAKDRGSVDAFFEATLAAGGRDEGEPGLRPQYHPDYYGAFVLDPDGNNVEAVCHLPA
jgi:catechol 2,3-dioxygenase-like lactoylglutathione lyase family enzyme